MKRIGCFTPLRIRGAAHHWPLCPVPVAIGCWRGGADASSLPPAATDGAAPLGTAPRDVAWQPAAAVVAAAAAEALPARLAVLTAADGATSPCLSAAARAAAAITTAA